MVRFAHTASERPLERRTQIDSVLLQEWTEGWRPDLQKSGAPANSIFDILNMTWNKGHTLSKRRGFRQIADDTVVGLADADFVLAPRVYTTTGTFPQYSQQILHFNKNDGELWFTSLGAMWEEFLSAGDGDDLSWSDHSLGVGSDSAVNRFRVWPITAVTFGSSIYITTLRFGGYDNNTTLADETATGLWQTVSGAKDSQSLPIIYDVQAGTFARPDVHDLDGTTTGFVGARTMIAKYARIFAANLFQEGVYRYPSRIYWCGTDDDPDEAQTWEALNYIDVGADDGQEVVRLLSFGDQILVFKNQSIWTLVGTDDTTFALYQLDDQLGTEGTYASCATAGTAYFLDERTGVWAYDGAEFNNISEPIKQVLLDDLNREAAYKAVLTIHKNLLYVSIPTGTESTAVQDTTYVYDTELRVWTKHDYGLVPSPFPMYSDLAVTGPTVSLSNNLFTGMPDIGVFELGTGLRDLAAAIDAYVVTPWLNFGNVADRHRLRRLEILGDETDGDVAVSIYTDLEFDTTKGTLTHDPATGTQNALNEDQTPDDYWWSWLSLKLQQDDIDEDFSLYALGFTYSTRPQFRGIVTKTGYSA